MFAALAVLGVLATVGTACAVRAWLRDQAAERAAFALEVHHEEYSLAPTRGDAQGRAGGCAPAPRGESLCRESRPAARAVLTGSLSPRPHQEGTPPVSAPPAGPARTSPAGTANAQVSQTAAPAVSIARPHTQLSLETLGTRPGALPALVTEEVTPSGTRDDVAAASSQPLRVTGAGGARPSPALSKAVTDALDAGWAIARSMTAVT